MKAEILETVIRSYETNSKEGQKQTRYSQEEIYLYTGARFPLMISVGVESLDKAYLPGEYILNPKCFRVSKYGGLELDPFGISLLPVPKPSLATPQLNK